LSTHKSILFLLVLFYLALVCNSLAVPLLLEPCFHFASLSTFLGWFVPFLESFRSVVLNRREAPPQWDVNKFPGVREPLALYYIESLINKFTKQYICFDNL